MTDKEVLQKAIEIAIENGWVLRPYLKPRVPSIEVIDSMIKTKRYMVDVFSHDFAKAFWDEDTRPAYLKRNETPKYNYEWEYNLMMMVLEENPIDYLRKFI